MLTTLLSAACLAYSAAANPLPPNGAGLLPSGFSLAPLYTPPPPPASSVSPYEVDSHIVRDSYLVVLEDHLAAPEVDEHHAQVEAIHAADVRINADDVDSPRPASSSRKHAGVKHKFHIGGNKHGHRRHAHKSKQLKGYSGSFSESTLDAIRAMKGVKYVERDSLVHTMELEKMAPWVRSAFARHPVSSFLFESQTDVSFNSTRVSLVFRTASRSPSVLSTSTSTRSRPEKASTLTLSTRESEFPPSPTRSVG